MSKTAFLNAYGGKMLVDDSRVEEYKAAGFMLAADVVDFDAVVIDEKPAPKKRTRKTKEA